MYARYEKFIFQFFSRKILVILCYNVSLREKEKIFEQLSLQKTSLDIVYFPFRVMNEVSWSEILRYRIVKTGKNAIQCNQAQFSVLRKICKKKK